MIKPVPLDVLLHIASYVPPTPDRQLRPAGPAFDVAAFVDRHLGHAVVGTGAWQGGRKWVLSPCPFNPEHTDRSAVVIEMPSGAAVFTCHHNGCAGKGWRELRELFEPPALKAALPQRSAPAHERNGRHDPTDTPEADRGEAGPLPPRFELSDLGNGERFHARHGEDAHYCPKWAKWLVWDGVRHAIDDRLEVMRLAKATVRSIYAEAAVEPDDERRAEIVKHARKCENMPRVEALVKAAQSHETILPEILDQDPWLFNCPNGTIDLRTGSLRPHRRGDWLTKASPVPYSPDAQCPRWEAFLHRVQDGNADVIRYLQRAVGYSLTGVTWEERLFFIHGPGRNGKSKFVHAIEHVFGEYATQTRPETIMVRNRADVGNEIAALAGARWVSTVEVEDGARLAEGLVKQLTGGDRMSARFLYGEFFDFRPTLKLWIVGNHMPIVRGTDLAVWERILLAPFTVVIRREDRDPRLIEKLIEEAMGILAWSVRGCLEWQERGLDPPEEVLAATEGYRREMDTLGDFLEDCCVLGEHCATSSTALYETYKEWASSSGVRQVWSQKKLSQALTERGFDSARLGHERHRSFIGVGLQGGSADG